MDIGAVLLDILIVLVAAKVAAEIAERINVPVVVAEIVAGIVVGSSVLDLVEGNQTLAVLAELGVILLLLQVGLEMNLRELGAVGRASMTVAVIGVVVPMATGFGVAEVFAYDGNTALFLGAALAATSVGITARVFADLRALATIEARTVLGAAVADDVLGLLILTVVVRIVTEGTISIGTLLEILVVAIGFLVVAAALGTRFAPPAFDWLRKNSRSAGTLVAVALAFTLALAELAEAAKLAPIIGAFVAGLALSQSSSKERIERELAPVGHLFIPVFFLGIGIDIDVSSFASPDVLGIAGALLVCAVVGKLVAGLGTWGQPGDRWIVGLGMLPRGEVGLIFATIGLQQGVLGKDLYAALLLVVLATTLLSPPLLKWRYKRSQAAAGALAPSEPKPAGGWLRVDERTVELAATPPAHEALHIGLEAALAVGSDRAPGKRLLDWLGSLGDTTLRWDAPSTGQLFAVLVDGNVRTWRFLETTGLLERALPELAEAVERRRVDPFVLEPAHVLRFDLVERVRDVETDDPGAARVAQQLAQPQWLLLAALILDAAGEDGEPVPLARRLVRRLDLGAAAEEEIALLVGDASLLRGAADRVDGLEEERVLQLATHLDTPERARALYVLTLAIGDLEPWTRERLDELEAMLATVLQQGDLTGREVRNLVERRRAEATRITTGDEAAAARIATAPRAYLLAQEAVDIARQAALLDPLPAKGAARVAVSPMEDPNEWRLEVVLRDRPALLAHVSGVLADAGLDVLDAVVATWPDGAALQSFHARRALLDPPRLDDAAVKTLGPPAPAELELAIAEALTQPLAAPANPDAVIVFDDIGSPWYTVCEVRSPDRRGLLHTITVGLAAAGADVHAARLVTSGDTAVDRFELTDRSNRKLDEAGKAAIVDAIVHGVARKARRRLALRRADG